MARPVPPDTDAAPQGESPRKSLKLANGTVLTLTASGSDADVLNLDLALEAAKRSAERPLRTTDVRPLVGESPAIKELLHLVDRVKATNVAVLITGENGTGKEVVARLIHTGSPRAKGPFVAVNCSAFNDNLLESELFGHRKGAFTDANADKAGLFQMADGGTFFMDEVGDMSPALQVKLLRVLQEGTFVPVGGTQNVRVDVRVVAATNRNLADLVASGKFRKDLYYRLNVVHIVVPALRERLNDIPLLVAHFLGELATKHGRQKTLAPDALEAFRRHPWPGNVRELENEIERLWVLSGSEDVITAELFDANPRRNTGVLGALDESIPVDQLRTLPEAVEALERRMILASLRRARGNKTRAASALGISRRNLIRKVQAYGLEALLEDSEGQGS